MNTATHDVFTDCAANEIRDWTKTLVGHDNLDGTVGAVASNIAHRSTTRIFLYSDASGGAGCLRHSPDSAFARRGARYPSVVIETSFAQKRKDLPKLAEDYILGSRGRITLVIGLDIEYRRCKRATLSMWRPERVVDNGVPFLGVKQAVDSKVQPSLPNP